MEEFKFFWKGPLSQWYLSSFVVDNVMYNCAEQFMMAEKARLFKDIDSEMKIMSTKSPREQQAIGRQVKDFHLQKWNSVARDIVTRGNIAKFSQNEDLKIILLSTDGMTLVEASPFDKIWGIGMAETDVDIHDKSKWRGTNWLGECLMNARYAILTSSTNQTMDLTQ